MTAPLVVSIPHRLGKEGAIRRLQYGLGRANQGYSHLFSIEEEVWQGDALSFRVRALGQAASGIIHVFEDRLHVELSLPWLLTKMAQRLVPTIQREGSLLLK